MVIASVQEVSTGCLKIITGSGPSFFVRINYLSLVRPEEITEGTEFTEEKENDILDAGLAFAAEKKAVDYLARAEQSHLGLYRKLIAKKFDENAVNRALEYLEIKGYLSDRRFARAWLNNRKIAHSEGRSKLASELAARGIGREDARSALDEFFENNSEDDLCARALAKCRRLKKNEEKTIEYLLRSGFSYPMIKAAIDSGSLPDEK